MNYNIVMKAYRKYKYAMRNNGDNQRQIQAMKKVNKQLYLEGYGSV